MIRRADEMRTEQRDHMRDGEGTVYITHMVEKDELPHGRLFAKIELPVGAGIGYAVVRRRPRT